MKNELDSFTLAFLTCALWSEVDDNGIPFDTNYSVDDFSETALQRLVSDCKKFQADNAELLKDHPAARCGQDFWLSRNGHGSDFFDEDWGTTGDKLQEAAHAFGEVYLYADDGQIFC